jgi:hypothetical protein
MSVSQVPRRPEPRWGLLALGIVLLMLLIPRVSFASRPVIPTGREDRIAALFVPHALGDELSPGWVLHSFHIETATVHLWIAGSDQVYAHLTLDHLDEAPADSLALSSFALTVLEQPPGSEAAVAELIAVIGRNDDGSFWRTSAKQIESRRKHRFEDELGPGVKYLLSQVSSWAKDGIALLIAFTLVIAMLVVHKLRGAEPWMKWSLLAIVLVGVVLRLTLSPHVGLEAWPYTRFMAPARLILNGPGLELLHPGPAWASETLTTTTLILALLAPSAVYVHARYLLDDHRAALVVAGIIAVLPMHLRFSHSDVAFIPSITVSSIVFALIHVATRDSSKLLGWFAVVVVGFPLALVYLVRPLNIMYFALLIATAFVNHGVKGRKHDVEKIRVAVVFSIVTAVTMFGGVPWLLESFGREVGEGLSLRTLGSALAVVASPRMNALLHPGFTPPGLMALAVIGAVDLWRRGRRPLFWYLVSWLLGFLVAHAYAVPTSPYMQARYHLHLIVPFVMLAACGVDATLRWLAAARARPLLVGRRYPAVIGLLVTYIGASPLIHLHFIRKTDFNEMREWLFVHTLRERIPARCDVIEFIGDTADPRMRRVGAYTRAGAPRSLWRVHEIASATQGEPEIPDDVRALLEDPPECLFWYEGLPCFGNKPIGLDKAAACQAVERSVVLEKVMGVEFDSNVYDENLGKGLGVDSRIGLSLFRVHRRPPG